MQVSVFIRVDITFERSLSLYEMSGLQKENADEDPPLTIDSTGKCTVDTEAYLQSSDIPDSFNGHLTEPLSLPTLQFAVLFVHKQAN